jgi:hypothetical protein
VSAAEHDDVMHDAIALVELVGSGDPEAVRAVLDNCAAKLVAARLALLLAGLVNENVDGRFVCAGCFREWALQLGAPGAIEEP